jgi:hypothetical protein
MNIPGFTAEVSLYKTSEYYQTGRTLHMRGAQCILPQIPPRDGNGGGCIPGCDWTSCSPDGWMTCWNPDCSSHRARCGGCDVVCCGPLHPFCSNFEFCRYIERRNLCARVWGLLQHWPPKLIKPKFGSWSAKSKVNAISIFERAIQLWRSWLMAG